MAIPLSTTHFSISRIPLSATEDAYDPNQPGPTVIATGVRAVLGAGTPVESTTFIGGSRGVFTVPFWCDPTDITVGDQVTDDNAQVWEVLDSARQTGLGIDYMQGKLRRVTGVV